MPTGKDFAEQIRDILISDPTTDAHGRTIDSDDPLYGTLVGPTPTGGAIDFRPYSGIAKGGIYTYQPKMYDPLDDRGVTPHAFANDPASEDPNDTGGKMRPTITVREDSQINHFQFQRITQAVEVPIRIWYYGPSTTSGKIALELMDRRVTALLHERVFTTDRGFTGQIYWNFHFGRQDNHREYPGSIVAYTIFHIVTLRDEEV